MSFNEEKLNQFIGNVLSDFGGSASAVLCYVGINLVCIKQCMILEDQ